MTDDGGLASISSTSSTTSGSSLLASIKRRKKTLPGDANHEGQATPWDDLRANAKKHSCGVVLVEVHSSEGIECNASGETDSQCVTVN